jgi:hypothetical protein
MECSAGVILVYVMQRSRNFLIDVLNVCSLEMRVRILNCVADVKCSM